ncbi:hypothetical protein TNCV_754171 [Trichonephila clavipes]|nr:hypothetical protein TNCV_754171 [Trichonephila clavipes]
MPAQMSSSSLETGSKLRDPLLINLVVFLIATFINTVYEFKNKKCLTPSLRRLGLIQRSVSNEVHSEVEILWDAENLIEMGKRTVFLGFFSSPRDNWEERGTQKRKKHEEQREQGEEPAGLKIGGRFLLYQRVLIAKTKAKIFFPSLFD